MIVKVQTAQPYPAAGPALIYSQGHKNLMTVEPDDLPQHVLEETKRAGGKSYFHAEIEDGNITFRERAVPQPW